MRLRSILLSGAVFFGAAPTAWASSSYVSNFTGQGTAYSQWAGNQSSPNTACLACHTDPNGGLSVAVPRLNSYGTAWRNSNATVGSRQFPSIFSPFVGPTAVNLTAVVSSMAATVSAPSTKVADISVVDTSETPANITANNVVRLTSGNAYFDLISGALYVKAGVTLTGGSTISATVSAEDETSGEGAVSQSYAVTITGGAPPIPGNLPPTGVLLTNLVATLSERQDTSSRIRVADIVVNDPDQLGTNTLTPIGPNATLFEISDRKLYLKAGTALDAATTPSLSVGVAVDDPSTTPSPDAQTASPLVIAITPGNTPPTLVLENVLTSVNQGANTQARVKVADIAVTDNDGGGGVNTLGLTGPDADLFEIDGPALFLRRGAATDATARPNLSVTVQVDDQALGSGPEASASLTLTVVLPLGEGLIEHAAGDPRLRSVGAALDDACSSLAVLATGARTASQAELFAACSKLTLDAQGRRTIDPALAALANEEGFAAGDATFAMTRAFSDSLFDRMSGARGQRGTIELSGLHFGGANPWARSLGYLAPRLLAQGLNDALANTALADSRWGVFAAGYMQSGGRDAGGAAGAADYDDYGLTVGADYQFGESFLAGLAISYADSETDFAASSSKLDAKGPAFALYGSFDGAKLKVDAQASLAPRRFSAARQVAFTAGGVAYDQTALAQYDGLEIAFGGRLRLPVDLGVLQAELIAGGTAVMSRIEAYEESGAGGFNLRVEEQNDHTAYGEIGGKLARSFRTPTATFIAAADVMYTLQAGQGSREIVAGFVADPVRRSLIRLSSDGDADSDFFSIGASLAAQLDNGLGVELGYRTILGLDGRDLQQVSLGVFSRF